MKLLTLIILNSVLFISSARCQTVPDTLPKPRTYNVIVSLNNTKKPLAGYLVNIQDSSLYISPSKMSAGFYNPPGAYLQKIDYKSINEIRLYQRSHKAITILVSAVVLSGIGALIGHASGNDSGLFGLDAGSKAVVGAVIGLGAGALIGSIIARSEEKKFNIGGEWKSLQEIKETVQNRNN